MTESEATNGQKNGTEEKGPELETKIIRQVEYYFGDYNLPRDKFLQEEVKNDDGWITMETMTKFKRLASLSTDPEVIAGALRNSTSKLVEVHESNTKLRRSPGQPLPIFDDKMKEETMKRTIYCKGFPKDGSATLDDLLEYFKAYGPYETVLMRYFFSKEDKKQGFKGSVLVVFPDEEKAKVFIELETVKYKDIPLIRKWHADYVEEKKKEIEERRAKKEARRKDRQEEEEEAEGETELPKGTFLHFSGLAEDSGIAREDIKAALGDSADHCAWIDFSRGKTEGYLRLKEADFNKMVLEKIGEKLKIKETEATVRLVEGEEEEEQLKKMQEARKGARLAKKRKNNGGGRGGGGRGFNKRRRM